MDPVKICAVFLVFLSGVICSCSEQSAPDLAKLTPDTPALTPAEPIGSIKAEVMILGSSEVPDPQSAPYAECLTHLQAKVIAIDGKLVTDDQTLNLVTWAFRNREWEDGGRLRRGCRISITGGDFFQTASQEVQQLQRVDTINDFDSPMIWVPQWQLLEGILASSQLPPRDEIVAKQLALIQHTMAGYGDLVIGGVHDGWFFDLKNSDHYKPDFWRGFKHSNTAIQGSYEAILTFDQQLKERGIQLHVAVAPRSSTIYPDLATNVRYDPNVHGRVNLQVAAFIEQLQVDGVDVIDLTPPLLNERWYKYKWVGDGNQRFPVFLPNDHHWSPIGVRLAARAIRSHLTETAGLELPAEALAFVEKKHMMAFAGMPYADWVYPPRDGIPQVFDVPYFTLIPKDEISEQAIKGAQTGPIHLIGDSFLWCHKTGNNLISHLTKELRQPLVFTGAAGGAETNVRRSWVKRLPDPEIKHVIWLVGENSLGAQERWHRVPFDDSELIRLTESDFEVAEEPIHLQTEGTNLSLQFGRSALEAGAEQSFTAQITKPLIVDADSFFDCRLRLVSAYETERPNDPNTAEYRFRLKFDGELVDEKFELTNDLNWKRNWRVDLSRFAGRKGRFEIEVNVVAGDEFPQEGFPLILEPAFEGAAFAE